MSVSTGPNRGLVINALTGDNFDVSFRALLRAIDALLVLSVVTRSLSTPPVSPANGARYIVGASPTGAWAGQANNIAVWSTDNPSAPSGEWEFYAAATGMDVYSVADAAFYGWSGSAWIAVGGGGGGLASKSNLAIFPLMDSFTGTALANESYICRIQAQGLLGALATGTVKVGLWGGSGGGVDIAKTYILRCLAGSTTVFDRYQVLWSGAANVTLSGSALSLSDAVTIPIDPTYDYYIVCWTGTTPTNVTIPYRTLVYDMPQVRQMAAAGDQTGATSVAGFAVDNTYLRLFGALRVS